MDRPDELPADFNKSYSTQDGFVTNALDWLTTHNSLTFDTTVFVSSANAESTTITPGATSFNFVTNTADTYTITQRTIMRVSGTIAVTLEEVSWTLTYNAPTYIF